MFIVTLMLMKNRSSQSIGMRGAYRRARFPMKLRMKASGKAVVFVMNPDGSHDRMISCDNLILNQGLDGVAVRKWCDNFLFCAAGSDGTVTSVSGGSSLATYSGNSVSVTGGFTFTNPNDIGKVIKLTSGQTPRITAYISATTVTVTPSQDTPLAANTFTVFSTNQTGLITEIQRVAPFPGVAYCGTTRSGNVFSHKRTFDFPAETGSVTYREIGFSHLGTAGVNLFSRIKLPIDLTLVAAQLLRVVYTLQITVDPDTPVDKAADIIGWPIAPSLTTDGSEQIQLFGLSGVDTTGATIAQDDGGFVNEPSEFSTAFVFLSTVSTAPAAFGSATDRTGTTPAEQVVTLDAYVPLSNTLDKVTTYGVDDANAANWRTIGLGRSEGAFDSFVSNTFVFVFDESQTKDELHTLELRFTFNWDREL